MSDYEKVLNAIIDVSNNQRPCSVNPTEIQKQASVDIDSFKIILFKLEEQGLLKLITGNNEITDISVSYDFPIK